MSNLTEYLTFLILAAALGKKKTRAGLKGNLLPEVKMHLLRLKKTYQYIYRIYQPLFFGKIMFHMRVVSIPKMTQAEFIVLLISRSIKSEFSFFGNFSFEFTCTWIVKHLKMLFRKSFFPFLQLLIGN